jgi:GntR family transcriptional repressor for pyruvate dehydrogenase complex
MKNQWAIGLGAHYITSHIWTTGQSRRKLVRNGSALEGVVMEQAVSENQAGSDASSVLERLRAALENGELVEAGRLPPERELAETIGVGRRSLRQALAHLEAEGIIWRRQGQGTFVSALRPREPDHFRDLASSTSPAEVMEVRLELEPVLARFCALRATRDQVERVRLAADHAAAAESSSAFETSDAAFHRALAEGANNSLFLAMFESITAVLRQSDWRAVRQSTFSHSRRSEVSHQHDDVVQAVVARDPFKAEQSMREHLLSVYAHLQNRHTPRG